MTTNKKLKIVVVGIGKTGCVLVDNKSKEVNRDDMKFVRIDWGFDESNPNATDIHLASILPHKTSFEEILEYLEYEGSRKRLLKFLATVQEGDELYKMNRITGCITTASDTRGIRLKRNGEIIDYVEIDYSILPQEVANIE